MAQDSTQAKHSEQNILNNVYETTYKALVTLGYGYDGVNAQVPIADSLATKIIESSGYTYVAKSAPGTADATAKWQAFRIDETTTGTAIIKWADGNANFDNTATDITALTYS